MVLDWLVVEVAGVFEVDLVLEVTVLFETELGAELDGAELDL